MKNYKFRGKTTDTGEWACGYIIPPRAGGHTFIVDGKAK